MHDIWYLFRYRARFSMHIHWCNCPVQILSLLSTVCACLFVCLFVQFFTVALLLLHTVCYWTRVFSLLLVCVVSVACILFETVRLSRFTQFLLFFSWLFSKLSAMITTKYFFINLTSVPVFAFSQLVYLWLARSFWYAIYMRRILCHYIHKGEYACQTAHTGLIFIEKVLMAAYFWNILVLTLMGCMSSCSKCL